MDIRNFFTPISSSSNRGNAGKDDKKKNNKEVEKIPSKRTKKCVILSSDSDEDPIPSKLRKKQESDSRTSKRTKVIKSDSDSDVNSKKPKKAEVNNTQKSPPAAKTPKEKAGKNPSKITKPITVSDFFGAQSITRSQDKITPMKRKLDRDEAEVHEDNDFQKTVKLLGAKKPKLQIETAKSPAKKGAAKTKAASRKGKSPASKYKKLEVEFTKKTPEKAPVEPLPKKEEKPLSKLVHDDLKSENEIDKSLSEEKKRDHGALYRQYLRREGPKAPGSKEIPEGAEGCMQGLTMAITGVLDSLEREEAAELIVKYGGKVTQSISKNTSYIVVGRDSGPAKLEKAENLGTKQVDEDGLLDLIRTLPGKEVKGSANSGKKNLKITIHEEEKEKPKTESMPKKTPAKSRLLDTDYKIAEKKSTVSPVASNMATNGLLWVDKYKPTSTKQIIGQQGDRSNVKKLTHWLKNWHSVNNGTNKKRAYVGRFGADDGSNFKAALLSGSPGVGKTTTAQLVCKENGFSYVELNASDTRSKKSLHNIVAEMVNNKSLSNIYSGESENHCLIMDEVDGMAGNEDRGGVQELIQLIKNTKIPIICLCNDRGHTKIRSLSNYCFDLRFQKPRLEQLKAAMMSICFKENVSIPSEVLTEICIASNQDVRQIIHHLFMRSVKEKQMSVSDETREAKSAKKDVKMGPFDVLRTVFSESEHKNMSIHDKTALFFHDYSIGPLFVQENYLCVNPTAARGNAMKHMDLMSQAADMICIGDTVDRIIRSGQYWSLLPLQAMFASVFPGDIMEGHIGQAINFPSWLGCNSSRNKFNRLTQELHMHMRLRISANKTELNCDYLQHVRDAIIKPLAEKEQDGVRPAMNVMSKYFLEREDLDSIMEVTMWSKQENPFAKLNPKVKAALTRSYNKEVHLNPYATVSAPKRRRGESNLLTEEGEELLDDDDVKEAEDEDIARDAMFKVKKQTAKGKVSSSESQPSTSKATSKKPARGRKKIK